MKRTLLTGLNLLAVLICCIGPVNAQLVNCNVYLKANHLEIGINNNGAIGSSYDPPTGYHNNVADTMYNDCTSFSFNSITGLGFVADPARDGWSTGTPAYFGDFILPSKPREGWGIADATASATAYSFHYTSSSSGYAGPLSGASTAYTATGTLLQGVWTGMFVGTDTINVVQTVTTDVNNLFLMFHVDFFNTGTSTDTIYYVRTVNPQNEGVTSSTNITKNKIEHQLPDPAGLVIVSAEGTTYTDAYMALGTNDARAKCFINRHTTLPGSGSFASVYAEDTANYLYGDLDSLTSDRGMGLVFKIVLGPGTGSSIDFGYSFKASILDSVLDTLSGPLTTPHRAGTQRISAYPNPARDLVNITGLTAGDAYALYDLLGRPIAEGHAGTDKNTTVSFGTVPPGTYMLIAKDKNGNIMARLPLKKE